MQHAEPSQSALQAALAGAEGDDDIYSEQPAADGADARPAKRQRLDSSHEEAGGQPEDPQSEDDEVWHSVWAGARSPRSVRAMCHILLLSLSQQTPVQDYIACHWLLMIRMICKLQSPACTIQFQVDIKRMRRSDIVDHAHGRRPLCMRCWTWLKGRSTWRSAPSGSSTPCPTSRPSSTWRVRARDASYCE